MSDTKHQQTDSDMKGWLYKWTNYIKGYQKRWFVLSNGLLSYYRTQAEMAHTCRGTISLHGAMIHTEDSCNFVISNGGTQTFHLKASSEVERQRWVTALELAKAKAIRMMESEDEEEFEDLQPMQPDKNELVSVVKNLSAKLEDLNTCNDLIVKHGAALQRSLSELEQLESTSPELGTRVKAVNERATLFRITSTAMMNTCADYLELAQSQGRKWQRMLQHEHEQRLRLEEMVEQLARQHSHLEQAAKEATSGHQKTGSAKPHSDGEDEFYDAEDHDFTVTIPSHSYEMVGSYPTKFRNKKRREKTSSSSLRRTASGISIGSEGAGVMNDGVSSSGSEVEQEGQEAGVTVARKPKKSASSSTNISSGKGDENPEGPPLIIPELSVGQVKRNRRHTIPEKPNYSLNLWSIMKNCIGKDLTKIPMPVNFSEPLSMLQRLTEEFEYTEILDRAAECDDTCEQLAYVAAFTVSPYATTTNRTGKPFNPLLGETYECDRRDDLGWRAISEQVSHHPPMAAQHCEGRGWSCWQEFTMSSKFRGKYLQVIPLGIAHLEFAKTGNHYTWRKVTTTVHNIIVGKLWVDQHGDMDIINHKTGDKCHLKYVPYSYFSRETPRKVTGVVTDPEGIVQWVLSGTWDNKLEGAKVLSSSDDLSKGKPRIETASPKILWKRRPEYEKIYCFTELAIQLNEPEEGVAPTDSRYRPDQRLMEEARWDEANQEKVRLEEKQRTCRRKREVDAEHATSDGRPYPNYEPIWFRKTKDPITGNPIHVYTQRYWEAKEKQEWSACPDIF